VNQELGYPGLEGTLVASAPEVVAAGVAAASAVVAAEVVTVVEGTVSPRE
jgi:hypothetical protein